MLDNRFEIRDSQHAARYSYADRLGGAWLVQCFNKLDLDVGFQVLDTVHLQRRGDDATPSRLIRAAEMITSIFR